MLIKLLKHEFKSNRHTFFALYAAVLSLGFIMRITGVGSGEVSSNAELLLGLVIILYAAAIIGTIAYIFVATIRSFNRSIFDRQGYLTLTLPVSTTMLIISKMIMATFWFIFSMAIVIISTLILVPDLGLVFDELSDFITTYGFGLTLWLGILLMFVSIMEMVLIVYLCSTFVHTKYIKGQRPLIAVVMFFVLNYVTTMIRNAVLPNFGGFYYSGYLTESAAYSVANELNSYISDLVLPSILVSLVIGILCFLGVKYLIEKKIELD